MTKLLRTIAALLLGAVTAAAAPVPVTAVSTNGNQLIALTVNGNQYPQAQLTLPAVTAFAAGGPTVPLVPNGAPVPAPGTRAGLLQDWLLDSGLINPAAGTSTVTITFATPIVNRPGADLVFMEINPGTAADAMQVTINGDTQVIASGSWGPTGYTASGADLYSTGSTMGSLAAVEAAALTLSSADITQNVFGVGVDLSDFGIAANASVSSVSFGSSGTTFDPVFIAGMNGSGVPPAGPVELPYVETFSAGPGSFSGGSNWVATGGVYRNEITASNTVSSASIHTDDLGGDPPPGFFLSSKFTVVAQTTTGNAVGLALFGTNPTFTGGVTFPYYLYDFRPGANVLRFYRVGVNNTAFLPDVTLQTMSVNLAQPFHLEVLGRYEAGALVMNLTIRQGAASETYYVVDSEPLTVGNFGYRNRTGAGGTLTVECDDFTLRHLSTNAFTEVPAPFARPGVPYTATVAATSDVGANVTLSALELPPWLSFTPGPGGTGTLSGTPTQAGGFSVRLRATDNENGELEQTFAISVLEPTGVIISEFLAENDSGLRDEDGDQEDWIELFNSDDAPADVSGWRLTDDPALPAKWTIPAGTVIAARGFLVIFASGKNRVVPNLHTNFRLTNSAGGYLALSNATGVFQSGFIGYPVQKSDRSFGAYGSYSTTGYLLNPTPGGPNDAAGYAGFVPEPEFSVPRGFYTSAQNVVISCAMPGATLVYTTDGSTPTPTHGTTSTSPLAVNIASTKTLRVAAFAPGYAPTRVVSSSYFFLEDIRQQPTSPPPGWPSGPVNGQVLQYGMDPAITGSVTPQQMKDALAAIPTLSLTTDLDHLFAPEDGIYVNPYGREDGYERPVSVELLHPDNTPGFEINAGIRIRGGFSRQATNPKHNFHLYFRGEYGAPLLRYRLFGDEGADEFDRIDLRSAQVRSWHNGGDTGATYNRDEWNRLTQGAMGQPYTRSRYYHLYINGHYWGIYGTQERADSAYASTYFGGKRSDYDVLKTYVIPHRVAPSEGDNVAWAQLHAAATAGFASDAAYWAVQGRDANGLPNGTLPLLDVDNLIDYAALLYYNGDDDAPVNTGVGGGVPKNFYTMRPRDGRWGFRFFVHDAESTMVDGRNTTGTITAGTTLDYFNPRWLSQRLETNARYRLRFADRVQRHWFAGGALDTPVALTRWQGLRAQINVAILGESARWGDAYGGTARTVSNFNSANNAIETGFLVNRRAVFIAQLRARNLYPSFDAPVFSQHGGNAPSGYALGISAPAGATIHYTTNGQDPTEAGAISYTQPVVLQGTQITVKSRARLTATGEWSAMTEATFNLDAVPAGPGHLAISEIHYNPAGPDDTEFVEIVNRSTSRIALNGVNFTGAMIFTFGNIILEPGSRILVVEDTDAIAAAYGAGLPVAGQWSGALNNDGDTVILRAANGTEIERVAYGIGGAWPTTPNGQGFSLVRTRSAAPAGDPAQWRASIAMGGNPGGHDAAPAFSGNFLADTDGDGLPAGVEHFLGRADFVPDVGALAVDRLPDGRATLTFRRRLAADDVIYSVEVSTDLRAPWTTQTARIAQQIHLDGTATETWVANVPASRQWLRLKVRQ